MKQAGHLFSVGTLVSLAFFGMAQNQCDPSDLDGDGWTEEDGDCDDSDPRIHPGAEESCDRIDNDCDDVVDDGVLGSAPACPGTSCLEIADVNEGGSDGLYWLVLAEGEEATEGWCEMHTDGGGWTLVQRTVWDWSESEALWTGYADWYESPAGSPDEALAYRMPGRYWQALNQKLDHMLVHYARDAAEVETCEPLYYLGVDGTYEITESTAYLTGLQSDVYFNDGGETELSTLDSGPSTNCVESSYGVPWFYGSCCHTCPTYQTNYWNDEPHPMVNYMLTTADYYGNTGYSVCPSGAPRQSDNGSNFYGIDVMEYYIR